jgi:hypothetical protein
MTSRLLMIGCLLLGAAACSGTGGAAAGHGGLFAQPVAEPPIDAEAWLADVTWLSADARRGRDTPSPELLETADFIARAFADAGLQPLGDDGGWLQHFEVRGRQRLVDGNELSLSMPGPPAGYGVNGSSARNYFPDLRTDWVPLQTALSGRVEGEIVFVGYGISDPHGGYDDYAGVDVHDKVVLVLRGGPDQETPGTRYAEGGEQRALVDFVSKINAAFRKGASALLVVNDPLNRTPGSRRDRTRRYAPLRGEGPAASLPAAHLTADMGVMMFAWNGLDLTTLQRGIDESGQPNSFAMDGQSVTLTIAAERPDLPTVNVLGYLPGSDPHLGNEHLLIGAHMDHLGTDEDGAGFSRGGLAAIGQIHNGADDNASGTAGVIALARWLGALPERPRRGIIFAAWSGEEWGLLGSRHYVEQPALPIAEMVTALNMDMIGRSKDGYVIAEGTGSATGFRELIVEAHDDLRLGLELHLGDVPSNNSDHAPFFEAGVPVLNFFTGLHDEYHMPSDDVELINADGGARIASLAGQAMRLIAAADTRPTFSKPQQPEPADPHGVAVAASDGPAVKAYGVVFGTSPDMAYQGDDGVRLSSVRDETPAQRAGVLAGDVIIAFDGKPVRNLQDYSVLLFSHRPGDVITVTVRRGGGELELTATLTGQADN